MIGGDAIDGVGVYVDQEEHLEHKSKGIYIRDDHCDWGSSGMNEFTEEYSSK